MPNSPYKAQKKVFSCQDGLSWYLRDLHYRFQMYEDQMLQRDVELATIHGCAFRLVKAPLPKSAPDDGTTASSVRMVWDVPGSPIPSYRRVCIKRPGFGDNRTPLNKEVGARPPPPPPPPPPPGERVWLHKPEFLSLAEVPKPCNCRCKNAK